MQSLNHTHTGKGRTHMTKDRNQTKACNRLTDPRCQYDSISHGRLMNRQNAVHNTKHKLTEAIHSRTKIKAQITWNKSTHPRTKHMTQNTVTQATQPQKIPSYRQLIHTRDKIHSHMILDHTQNPGKTSHSRWQLFIWRTCRSNPSRLQRLMQTSCVLP